MLRKTILAGLVMTVVASAALAAALTASDDRYLQDRYGLTTDSETIKGLGVDEQARLHDLINDPALKKYPNTRDRNVADFLLSAYLRGCSVWWLSHGGPECPPTSDASAEPGMMPRVLGLFAKRGLVPTSWTSRVGAEQDLTIDIQMAGMSEELADYVTCCLRQIPGVQVVLASTKWTAASANS